MRPYRLKFKRPWVTARGTLAYREGLLLALRGASGTLGWGDCAPLPTAGTETLAEAAGTLQRLVSGLPEPAIDQDLDRLPPATRCAIETALLDLRARDLGCPLADLLGGKQRSIIRVNAACGELGKETAACVNSASSSGFDVIKLKVGLAEPETEAATLRRLARQTGPSVRFRLDANGAWTPRQARRFVDALGTNMPIESLEEPLARPDHAQLAALQRRCLFPLALDESLAGRHPEYPGRLPPVRRMVLKPTVLGGPRHAMVWARCAQRAGMQVVVTSTLESAVGLAMAAQVAAALATEGVHGLATGTCFASDTADFPAATSGILSLPETPGLGVEPVQSDSDTDPGHSTSAGEAGRV